MIIIIGDVHGFFGVFERLKEKGVVTSNDTIIQVGDFGFHPSIIREWNRMFPKGYPCRVLAIAGNHENYTYLDTMPQDELTEVSPNLFYVPRGHVMEIEGKLFGFLGGAESVDKAYRSFKVSWWPQEQITELDVDRLITNIDGRELDVFIGHTPPLNTIHANFPRLRPGEWKLPVDWKDESSIRMQRVVETIKFKLMFCGHWHEPKIYGNIRILGTDEAVAL